MELIVKAFLIKKEFEVDYLNIKVTKINSIIVKKKLLSEQKKIIDYFKYLKSKELIKSIWMPKNKSMQSKLNELVKVKRDIKKSIDKINELFYR